MNNASPIDTSEFTLAESAAFNLGVFIGKNEDTIEVLGGGLVAVLACVVVWKNRVRIREILRGQFQADSSNTGPTDAAHASGDDEADSDGESGNRSTFFTFEQLGINFNPEFPVQVNNKIDTNTDKSDTSTLDSSSNEDKELLGSIIKKLLLAIYRIPELRELGERRRGFYNDTGLKIFGFIHSITKISEIDLAEIFPDKSRRVDFIRQLSIREKELLNITEEASASPTVPDDPVAPEVSESPVVPSETHTGIYPDGVNQPPGASIFNENNLEPPSFRILRRMKSGLDGFRDRVRIYLKNGTLRDRVNSLLTKETRDKEDYRMSTIARINLASARFNAFMDRIFIEKPLQLLRIRRGNIMTTEEYLAESKRLQQENKDSK